MQYMSEGRRIVLGLSDNPHSLLVRGPQEIDRLARSDYCQMGKAYWGENAANHSTDWRVTPLDFGEGIAAFQSVYWHGKGLIPSPEPVLEDGGWLYAVARAYGIVDDTYIMVCIDLENTSAKPPTEEELRARTPKSATSKPQNTLKNSSPPKGDKQVMPTSRNRRINLEESS